MRKTPLERMIDSTVRCTVCNALRGQCDCWTKCECGWSYRAGGKCRNPFHGGDDPGLLEVTHFIKN